MRLHIDTDFAGDTDDACALAMVLAWPGAEVVGITTVADPDGQRAGYLAHFLALAGRSDIPIAAGAGRSLTTGAKMGGLPDHARYWGYSPVPPLVSPPGAAVDLLARSLALGATVAAIGPLTNLALLEAAYRGRLAEARVVAMGGWLAPPAAGLPAWGPEMDWNVQCDTRAAATVAEHADLTLVTLPATLTACLRAEHLPALAAAGPLGALLARQCRAHAEDNAMPALGRAHPALPDDLVNFHYDPVACAVALGWPGATIATLSLSPVWSGDLLRFTPDHTGRPARVVTAIAPDFAPTWLSLVTAPSAFSGPITRRQ